MSDSALYHLELATRRSLAFVTALVAVFLDLLPIPSPSPLSVAPLFALAVVFHWTVHRPDLFTPFSAFLLGVLRDLAGGLPLGLHALTFVLVPLLLQRAPRGPLVRSLPLAWLAFTLVALAAALLRWLLAGLVWLQPVPPRDFLLEALATVVLYPLVVWILAPVARTLPRTAHAPGS